MNYRETDDEDTYYEQLFPAGPRITNSNAWPPQLLSPSTSFNLGERAQDRHHQSSINPVYASYGDPRRAQYRGQPGHSSLQTPAAYQGQSQAAPVFNSTDHGSAGHIPSGYATTGQGAGMEAAGYYHQSNAASSSNVTPQALPHDSSHSYRLLPSNDQAIIDGWLEVCEVDNKRAYQCVYEGCNKSPFKNKDNARVHVHKHLGTEKRFECVTCQVTFGSEDSAKRHRDTISQRGFECRYCHNSYARKDYRNTHEKKCLWGHV